MTDEQIIEILQNIQRNCEDNCCDYCEFYLGGEDSECQIGKLVNELSRCPKYWNIDEIERIIKQ